MDIYLIDLFRVLIHLYSLTIHYFFFFIVNIINVQKSSTLTTIQLSQLLHSNNLSISFLSNGFVYSRLFTKLYRNKENFINVQIEFYKQRFKTILPITYLFYFSAFLFSLIIKNYKLAKFIFINLPWHSLFILNIINVEKNVKNIS